MDSERQQKKISAMAEGKMNMPLDAGRDSTFIRRSYSPFGALLELVWIDQLSAF